MAFLRRFTRKKVIDREETSTELHRVLSGVDLTLLGIGSTLGVGIYVLAGEEAKKDAGPAVVVSFFVAAVASVLAGKYKKFTECFRGQVMKFDCGCRGALVVWQFFLVL